MTSEVILKTNGAAYDNLYFDFHIMCNDVKIKISAFNNTPEYQEQETILFFL